MPELFLGKFTEMFCVWITSSLKWSWLVKSLLFSVTQSCATLCNPMDCSTPGFPVLCCLLVFAQTHVHWISDVVQPSHPLLPLSPPPLYLFQHQGLFQWAVSLHQVAKVLELQLQHQSFQWLFGTDFFRIVWFDLLAAQGTLKSFLQHHSLKISIVMHSTFSVVQLSHPYMTTGKNAYLAIQTFVSKVMRVGFNMVSRSIIAFLPKDRCLLLSWLQSASAVILEPK